MPNQAIPTRVVSPRTMNNTSDLRRRLRQLGRRTIAHASVAAARGAVGGTLEGEEIATPLGTAYRMQRSYPSDHQHGPGRLSDLLVYDALLASDVARQPALAQARMDGLLFLDTETTGLAGGAGTLAFLVGVGTFTAEGFRLRQYFLRDPAEEAAMLHALLEDLEAATGLVTFNGQAFDLPLLELALHRRPEAAAQSNGGAPPRSASPLAPVVVAFASRLHAWVPSSSRSCTCAEPRTTSPEH